MLLHDNPNPLAEPAAVPIRLALDAAAEVRGHPHEDSGREPFHSNTISSTLHTTMEDQFRTASAKSTSHK